jgi:hypothetical protein
MRKERKEDLTIVSPTRRIEKEKGIVEKQYSVINGCLVNKPFRKESIVFAEGWPSLSLVLHSLGFLVESYVEGLDEKNLKILRLLLEGQIEMMAKDSQMNSIRPGVSVWIQGSTEFVDKLRQELDSDGRVIVGISSSKGRRKETDMGRCKQSKVGTISHAAVGGITMGRWAYTVPSQVRDIHLEKTDKVQRSLQHILAHTETGFPHKETKRNGRKRKRSMDEEVVYKGENRVVPGCSRVVVSTHCVKQPYHPRIKRFLTTKELLDVYDVQTRDQEIICKTDSSELSIVLKDIVKAVPEKIVYRIANQVKESCLEFISPPKLSKNIINIKDERPVSNLAPLQWLNYEEDDKF